MSAGTLEQIEVTGEGVTASLLAWRRFKRPMPGLVERILALNPDIVRAGVFIPVGTVVTVPVDPPARVPVATPVRLWSADEL